MLTTERQNQILEMIQEKKYCTVDFLAKHFFVAPITIRRDLSCLEAAGLIKRCHGGASLPEHQNREVPYDLRDRTNPSVKAELGRRAAALLKDGDTVFMDASTTVRHIVDYIYPEQNLTIITNSMKVLEKLTEKHIRCYLTGGMLLENSFALVGKVAERALLDLYADVCFFSSQGITEEGVITDFSEAETGLRQLMIKNAKRRVFLFDDSKLGKRFLFRVCDSSAVDDFITNARVDFGG